MWGDVDIVFVCVLCLCACFAAVMRKVGADGWGGEERVFNTDCSPDGERSGEGEQREKERERVGEKERGVVS